MRGTNRTAQVFSKRRPPDHPSTHDSMLWGLTRPMKSIAKLIHHLALVLAVAFLGLIAGSYLVFVNAFPARQLTDAYKGGHALLDKWSKWRQDYPTEFWQPLRRAASGVTVYDPQRAANGLTLYTTGGGQRAVLISMTGEVVHEWRLPFSEVWDESAAVRVPQPEFADLPAQGPSLSERRSAGDLRGCGRYPLGLRPGQDGQELEGDLEIPAERASRSGRRQRRPDLRPDPGDQVHDDPLLAASGAAARR